MSHSNLSAFKSLLFADQDIRNLPVEVRTDEGFVSAAAYELFAKARSFLMEGNVDEAKTCLQEICDTNDAGTRLKLWSWHCLRDFGIWPKAVEDKALRGVVIEIRGTQSPPERPEKRYHLTQQQSVSRYTSQFGNLRNLYG